MLLLPKLLLLAALIAVPAIAQTPSVVRIALVIGNAAYADAPRLVNSTLDARAIGRTLRQLGFQVIEVVDGTRDGMRASIALARKQLAGQHGVGVFYYSGHGLQVDARNYLVPVNASIRTTKAIATQAVDVSEVIDAFRGAGTRMNIVVLDACRDNPFGAITSGKGLAPQDAPPGTFLAYATAPGNVADDGDPKAGNGLYTQHLLKEITREDARIEDVFKRVRFAVRKASQGRQIPWESTSLEEDFYFGGKIAPLDIPTTQRIIADFSLAKSEWDRIKDSKDPDVFYTFLARYPNGPIAEAAHARLNVLAASNIVYAQPAANREALGLQSRAFRLGDVFEESVATQVGKHASETTMTSQVDRIDEMEVVVTSGVDGSTVAKHFTLDGAVTKLVNPSFGGDMVVEPPQRLMPAGIPQVGQRWTNASETRIQGKVLSIDTSYGEIVAKEHLSIPAGEFDAFRYTERQVGTADGKQYQYVCTHWMDVALPVVLRSDCTMDMQGVPQVRSIKQLVKYKRGPGSTARS